METKMTRAMAFLLGRLQERRPGGLYVSRRQLRTLDALIRRGVDVRQFENDRGVTVFELV